MQGKRRKLPAELKAKVALEALAGAQTVNEIASLCEVHPHQVSTWKRQLAEAARDFFTDRRGRRQADDQELQARLYQQIGQLQVELDWLKKKIGLSER
jgi:putative transposase